MSHTAKIYRTNTPTKSLAVNAQGRRPVGRDGVMLSRDECRGRDAYYAATGLTKPEDIEDGKAEN